MGAGVLAGLKSIPVPGGTVLIVARQLSRQQTADTLAYILSVNQFPAGKTELPRQTEMLREIRFEATKPDPKGK
jgi:hypothetical protein